MKIKSDLLQRIKSFNSDRLPDYLKLKYDAMYADRYRFFRATAHLFFEDIPPFSFLHSSPNAWICGDLHLENYGSYKGDNRLAYFNVNDFDEGLLGPCLFDVVRLLCSIYVAAGNLGVTKKDADYLSGFFVDTYMDKLGKGYIRVLEKETSKGIMRNFLKEVETRKRKKFLQTKTKLRKGKRKLLIDNKHFFALKDKEKVYLSHLFSLWTEKLPDKNFYKIIDMAFRVAGTSSLGLRRYAVLIEGNGSPDQNYLLEMKESRKSCVELYSKAIQPKWMTEGQRIVEVQKRVLSDPPALLNNMDMLGRNYVMKELQPMADRIDYSLFKGNIKKMMQMLENMACIYAWSNLRSSGRQNSAIADDFISFAKNENKLKKEMIKYAYEYSKTIKEYHEVYCKAYKNNYF